jgi:hypothetical protein
LINLFEEVYNKGKFATYLSNLLTGGIKRSFSTATSAEMYSLSNCFDKEKCRGDRGTRHAYDVPCSLVSLNSTERACLPNREEAEQPPKVILCPDPMRHHCLYDVSKGMGVGQLPASVLADRSVFHDHQHRMGGVCQQLDIVEWVALDQQQIGKRSLFDDAELSRIGVAGARQGE